MNVLKLFLLAFVGLSLYANSNLASHDKYFKEAIAKSKLHNFGKGRVVAVLDTGINDDNPELKYKLVLK